MNKFFVHILYILCIFLYSNSHAQASLTVQVDTSATSIRIPKNFIGLSYDPPFTSQFFSPNYEGNNHQVISKQLLENFLPYQEPDIRLLGNNRVFWRNGTFNAPSSWNVVNNYNCISCPATPPDITTSFSINQLNTYGSFIESLSYKPTTLFGISLAFLDSARARDFATAVQSRFGDYPYLFEIGNEPDIYIKLGRRTSSYSFTEYLNEFNLIKQAVLPYGNVAGPTLAIINNSNPNAWSAETGRFIKTAGNGLKLVTMHQYPLGENDNASIDWLRKYLSEIYTFKRVNDPVSGIKLCIDTCKKYNVPFRLAETNTITLGGFPGVSDAFGSALWIMDYMFELAKAGSEGIHVMISGGSNFHYSPYTFTNTFLTGTDKVRINPIYYGMLFFSRCAVKGSTLLNLSPQNNSDPNINTWATKDSSGTIRVLVINRGNSTTDMSNSSITIRVPGAVLPARRINLLASGGSVIGNIGKTVANGANFTIGGQTISPQTGEPEESFLSTTVSPVNNRYSINVTAGSATILEIPPSLTTAVYSGETNATNSVRIYPNPASDQLTIEGLDNRKTTTVEIIDMNGIKQWSTSSSQTSLLVLPISRLAEGTYLIKITCEEKIQIKKIVINRNN